MSNYTNDLADKFLSMSKLAATKASRSDLEKELKKARKMYAAYKARLDLALKRKEQIEKEILSAESGMVTSRKTVLRNHDLLRNMDLAGADNIQYGDDNEDVLYIIDGKKHTGTFDNDGGVTLTPFGGKRNKNMDKDTNSNGARSDISIEDDFTDIDEKPSDEYFWDF